MGIFDSFPFFFKAPQKETAPSKTANLTGVTSWQDFSYMFDKQPYLQQYFGYVYVAVSFIAEAMSSQKIKLMRRKNGQEEELSGDKEQILQDLYHFNDHQTLYESRQIKEMHMGLAGEAFWYIRPSKTLKGKEFFALNPEKMKVIVDQVYGLPAGYEYYDANGSIVSFGLEDIIHFKNPNPINWLRGFSPLLAGKYSHNTWEAYAKYNYNFIKNDARPNGMLFFEGGADDAKLIEKMLKSKYSGSNNAGKTAVVNVKADYIETGKSGQEMQFEEGMNRMRDDIFALYKIPKDLIIGSSTYQNSSEAQRIFQTYTILPKLRLEASVFNEQLVPKYYGSKTDEIFFTFENPVSKDDAKESTRAQILYTSGIANLNEAREMNGLAMVDGGEEFYKPPQSNPFQNQAPVPDQGKGIKELTKAIKDIKKTVDENFEVKSIKDQMRIKLFDLNLSQEEKLIGVVQKYFGDQEKRLFPKKTKAFSLKTKIMGKDEDELGVNVFMSTYEDLATSFSNVAGDIVEELAGDQAPVTLSPKARKQLTANLEASIKDINANTRTELDSILVQSIENNWSNDETKKAVIKMFDKYILGQANVEVLKSKGVWEDRSVVNVEGNIVKGSANRYNKMLENISNNLTGDDQRQALQALVNATDYSDELSVGVEKTINSIYGIQKQEGMNSARASTITVTETNKIKNLAMSDRYNQNEVVTLLEWTTAQDNYVRGNNPQDQFNHVRADGERRKKGEKFTRTGEALAYPADPSGSLGNIINCRCSLLPIVE